MTIRSVPILGTPLAWLARAALVALAALALGPVGPGAAGIAWAGEGAPPGTGPPPRGHGEYFWVEAATVVSLDPGTPSITVEEPEGRFTYLVNRATLIRKNGETIGVDALESGDRLAISAHVGQEVKGRPIADTIQVVPSTQQTQQSR